MWDQDQGLTADRQGSILQCSEERGWLIRWPVPLKSGPAVERLAVNWLTFDRGPFWHTKFTDQLETVPDPRAHNKLKNTEAFYEHLVRLGKSKDNI